MRENIANVSLKRQDKENAFNTDRWRLVRRINSLVGVADLVDWLLPVTFYFILRPTAN